MNEPTKPTSAREGGPCSPGCLHPMCHAGRPAERLGDAAFLDALAREFDTFTGVDSERSKRLRSIAERLRRTQR